MTVKEIQDFSIKHAAPILGVTVIAGSIAYFGRNIIALDPVKAAIFAGAWVITSRIANFVVYPMINKMKFPDLLSRTIFTAQIYTMPLCSFKWNYTSASETLSLLGLTQLSSTIFYTIFGHSRFM